MSEKASQEEVPGKALTSSLCSYLEKNGVFLHGVDEAEILGTISDFLSDFAKPIRDQRDRYHEGAEAALMAMGAHGPCSNNSCRECGKTFKQLKSLTNEPPA